jgi:HlyD family secretion protein
MGGFREMNQETSRPAPDLSALRIRREPEKARGPKGWLLGGAVLVVAIGAAAYFFAGRSLRPRTVEVVTASLLTEGQASTVLTATGYVEAERKADLSPKITSRITELNVTEGTRVKRGDVIARLDHTDLDAQLAEKRAAWINAKAELARQQSLHAEGLAPKSALDAAVAAEATTRAAVRYVEALLDYTVIRAPFDGDVTAKPAFVGEAGSPFGSSPSGGGSGGAIVTLVEFSTLSVGADVNVANLSKLGPYQPA